MQYCFLFKFQSCEPFVLPDSRGGCLLQMCFARTYESSFISSYNHSWCLGGEVLQQTEIPAL